MKYNPHDLMNGLSDKNSKLSAINDELPRLAEEMAQAEHDYNILFATELLKARASGVPATIMKDIVKGNKEVAKARLRADVAKGVYDARKERAKEYKDAIGAYQSILAFLREEFRGGGA